jgi:hypothetical protein
MAEFARRDVEVLVHTSAPSRACDDARYRSLAQAYLDCRPKIRLILTTELRNSLDINREGDFDTTEHLLRVYLQSTQDDRESRASYRPDRDDIASNVSSQCETSQNLTGLSSIESPQLSFQSVMDNVHSPRFHTRLTRSSNHEFSPRNSTQSNNTQISAASWHDPLSTVADSQPENEWNLIENQSPTRVMEHGLQNQSRLDICSQRPILKQDQAGELDLQSNINSSLKTYEEKSVQPPPFPQIRSMSTLVSKLIGEGKIKKVSPNEDHCPVSKRKSICPDPESARFPSFTPQDVAPKGSHTSPTRLTRSTKRQRIEPISSQLVSHNFDPTRSLSSHTITPTIVSTEACTEWSTTLEIRPTPPRTSSSTLLEESLVTEPLKQLVAKVSSSQCIYPFIPLRQTRELRSMERGYWLVNCQQWDRSTRIRCWGFLGQTIGRDLIGWGVSCTRDPETSKIRVYCWGTVVEHIYLLLHMASASKIKGTGACWLGGDGTAIIIMPS